MTKARTLADNFAADINGITASAPLTGGGTSGTVTVGIQAGTTAQSGAVQLTDSTASTSTTTAATPNSVKSAYDLANGAIAKSTVDAKGDLLVGTANDTIGRLAVASTAGYVLTVDSAETTGLKWAAAGGGGLVFIGSTAVNGVTTNINSVFSSTYQNYRIIMALDTSAAGQIQMRFRASGTDTTSGYQWRKLQAYSTTVDTAVNNSAGLIEFGDMFDEGFFITMDVMNPNVAAATFCTGIDFTDTGANTQIHLFGGVQTGSTQFDGFTIFGHSSQTITGDIRVYGYANS